MCKHTHIHRYEAVVSRAGMTKGILRLFFPSIHKNMIWTIQNAIFHPFVMNSGPLLPYKSQYWCFVSLKNLHFTQKRKNFCPLFQVRKTKIRGKNWWKLPAFAALLYRQVQKNLPRYQIVHKRGTFEKIPQHFFARWMNIPKRRDS